MNSARALGYEAGALPMSTALPIVFIVDDDVSVRESLELLVRNENWKPETFASAKEFLNHPRTLVPSCLVLDLSLPGLNGLELQKQLAIEHIDMPIIFITRLWRCAEVGASHESRCSRILNETARQQHLGERHPKRP